MSRPVPNGPLIPSSSNYATLTSQKVNTESIIGNEELTISSRDITLSTSNVTEGTAGSLTLSAGTGDENGSIVIKMNNSDVYEWPKTAPPFTGYALVVQSIEVVGSITKYVLGWSEMMSICFHSSSYVYTEDGSKIALSGLKYGTRVLTVDNDYNLVYSPVIEFTGVFPERSGSFIRIYHEYCKEPLTLSPTHLILKEGNMFIQAKDITVGSNIIISKFNMKKLSTVTKIETGYEMGWYTPLTETGTIVVNDIVASCHTSGPHKLVKFMYWPLKMYLKLFPKKHVLPTTGCHWYSISFRRGPIGRFIEKCLHIFDWED